MRALLPALICTCLCGGQDTAPIQQWRIEKLTSASPLPELGKASSLSARIQLSSALSQPAVENLQAALKRSPDDIEARVQLLAYFANREDHMHDAAAKQPRFENALWMINNSPRNAVIHKWPNLFLANITDPADPRLPQIISAWQNQVKAHPDDPLILENASTCLQWFDYIDTGQYLQRLRQLEPTYPAIAVSLALLYARAIAGMTDPHPPLPPDGFGSTAQTQIEQSTDLPVIGLTGEALCMLGRMQEPPKSYLTLGESLLKKAQQLDPTNARWGEVLGGPPVNTMGMIVSRLATHTTERDLWVAGNLPEFQIPADAARVPPDEQATKLIHSEAPDYPLGRLDVSRGAVELRALIAKDGSVKKIEVISGPTGVIPSVIDAVRTWKYAPTLVDGKPVEVSTRVALEFTVPPKPGSAPHPS